ncbi:MAG TPA: polysaccharide deacetylase family protein [Pirellulaceae bacterium]|nr:polysaccharide deacetylase family protein [Pirellulaceae bacterium]
MPETVADVPTSDVETVKRFPELSPALMSARRRLWHRCVSRAISPLSFLGPTTRNAAGILTYHRVADGVGPDHAMLNVSPEQFRRQIGGLLKLGYQPLPLRSLIEARRKQQTFSPRTFSVVFDDGYSDIFRNAWPVLRELHVPATVFLATGYLDSGERFPFDDWSQDAAATARPLSTIECRKMLASGLVEFGSHTHSHEDFRNRLVDFRCDLQRSLDVLRERFGIEAPLFSFPYGFASRELTHAARELGPICGLTADCQLVTTRDDPFRWGRFGAIQLDTPRSLAAKLDGWYSTYQNVWRALSGRGERMA